MTEYKPTEYIVDFGDYRSNQFVRLNMALIEQNSAKLGEKIVRCMDCAYYDDEPDLESSMPKCWRDPDHHGTAIWTRPDGFCAWGEKVVDE